MAKITEFMDGKSHAKLAEQMAEQRVKELHKIGMGKGISNANNASEAEKKAFEDLADKYFEVLKTMELPEEYLRDDKITIGDYIAIAESGKPASEFFNNKKIQEFKGDASNIMDMSNEERATMAAKYGYDWGNLEDRKEFLKIVQDERLLQARAKAVSDFEKEYPVSNAALSLAYPTLTTEAKKQAFTGDYDDKKLESSKHLDILTAAVMAGTPAKIANKHWLVQPAIQGAAEAGRQGAQYGMLLGDEEFNPGEAGAAFVAGATIPGAKGAVQGQGSRFGDKGKAFAEGIEKTTKGTAKDLEQQAFKKTWDKGRKIEKTFEDVENGNGGIDLLDDLEVGEPIVVDWKSKAAFDDYVKSTYLYKKWKEIYPDLTPDEFFKNPNEFTKQEALVDMPPAEKHSFYFNGKKIDTNLDEMPDELFGGNLNGKLTKNNQWLKDQLPETYKDVTGEVSVPTKLGYAAGKLVDFVGGRAEPTIGGNLLGGHIGREEKPLEEQAWFKKLPKNKQEIILKAYKSKEDELLAD